MYINSEIIKDGITPEILKQLIDRHMQNADRYAMLKNYYCGRHDILNRTRNSETAANNKVAANWAKYITTVAVSYLLGIPITYDVLDKYDITPVLDCYRAQHISGIDSQLGKEASICGVGIEMVYADEDGNPKSYAATHDNAFVVYDDTVAHNKLFGVHYYTQFDVNGQQSGVNVYVSDAQNIYTYFGYDISALRLEDVQPHYFGAVPFIEYLNNDERQGDFEQQISLIDAYNTLMSDRINDKVQFVDAFLLLLGIEIDSTQAKKLMKEKILCGDSDAKAQYLSKVLSETDVEVLRKAIKDDIHQTSMVPDLSDEKFGNNTSGVAIKYKLLVFEQLVMDKERLFEKGLRERFELYSNFYAVKANMQIVPSCEVDIHFKRNLPANELELSQIVGNLRGMVSTETLLGTLPFVCDPKEEAKLAAREKSETEKQSILNQRELMRFGGEDDAKQ